MLRVWLALMLLLFADVASAAVTVTFYSRELGSSFPHAFFTLKGTLDVDGSAVDTNYGFTAANLSPAILLGPVRGEVETLTPGYIAGSDAHIALVLTDVEYGRLVATVQQWRNMPGRSYDLNRRNCVHFIAAAARAVGLDAPDEPKLMKKPRSYLASVAQRNRELMAARASSPAQESIRRPSPTVPPTPPVAATVASQR